MMDAIPESIADLLDLTEVSPDSSVCMASAMRTLRTCRPSLLVLAESDGNVIAADSLDSKLSVDAAGSLAMELAEHLAERQTCRLCIEGDNGTRQVLGLRLSGCAGQHILGCLLDSCELANEPVEELQTAFLVCAAVTWASARNKAEEVRLRTQNGHLIAEHDTLRASYSRATTAAIEEREQRLREQEEHMGRLQAVMMMAADGIVTVDERGIIESCNEAAGWIFGYAPDEVVGQNVSILMPSPYREEHDQYLADYVQSGLNGICNYAREATGRRKDGTTFSLELAVSEVSLGERRIFTGIIRDITERKRAEDELKRLHLQNELILTSAGEGIYGLDRDGNATFVNPAAVGMFGWRPEEVFGKRLHELLHHTHLNGKPYPWNECPVHRTLQDGSVPRVDHEVFWKKDGASFPVEYTSTPIREGAEIVGAVVTFRDITERRLLERQLAQAQKLESIGQLAAGVAHEINTPTQYIGDNTRFLEDTFQDLNDVLAAFGRLFRANKDNSVTDELLAEVEGVLHQTDIEYLVDEIPKAIQQSLEGVDRVAKIVRSMKEFSHPGGEQKQAIDLNRAIENTLTICRNEWKYVADAVTDLAPDLPPLNCFPAELNQVILNLIINAAHAIREKLAGDSSQKGTITVTTRGEEDWVEIRIEDTGTGICEEIRPKIMDPFFTTKEVGHGTGQGLAIVHSVVTDKHAGTLTFETEVGRGTTFIIRLPVDREPSSTEGTKK